MSVLFSRDYEKVFVFDRRANERKQRRGGGGGEREEGRGDRQDACFTFLLPVTANILHCPSLLTYN